MPEGPLPPDVVDRLRDTLETLKEFMTELCSIREMLPDPSQGRKDILHCAELTGDVSIAISTILVPYDTPGP